MAYEVRLCSDLCQNLFLKGGIILQMNSQRSKLRLPKSDSLVVYCKDPLPGLLLGFYRNIPALDVLLRCSLLWQWHSVCCSPLKTLCSLHLVVSSTLHKHIFAVVLWHDLVLSHPIMGSQKWLPWRKKVLCVKNVNMLRGGLAPCFHFWLCRCFWGGQKKAQPQPFTDHFLFFPAQPFYYSHTLCLSNPLKWDTKVRQGHLFSPDWS